MRSLSALILRSRAAASRRMLQEVLVSSEASFETRSAIAPQDEGCVFAAAGQVFT